MIDTIEMRILASWLFVQILFWGMGSLLHYGAERDKYFVHIQAPRWLRIIFGDFRHSGALDVRAVIIQVVALFTLLIACMIAWCGELTRDYNKWLIFAQWGGAATLVTLSRLLRKKQ